MGLAMAKWALVALVAILAVGCTTSPGYGVKSRYHGVPVDLFFLEWGAPVSSHELQDGGTVYLWYANRDSGYIPGHTDTELIGNTAWYRGYKLRNFTPLSECGVRIVTNPDGTIRDVLLHKSSKGWWTSLKCSQVFGPPVR